MSKLARLSLCRLKFVVATCFVAFLLLQLSLFQNLSSLYSGKRHHAPPSENQDDPDRIPIHQLRAKESDLLRRLAKNYPSKVHCVGENFLPNSWMFRSCRLEHLCYDLQSNDYILFHSTRQKLSQSPRFPRGMSDYARSSTTLNHTYRGGGVAVGPLTKGRTRQKQGWFPLVKQLEDEAFSNRVYYELRDDVVWAPFALAAQRQLRPMSVLFDYLLPIFNLQQMFGLEKNPLMLSTLENLTGSETIIGPFLSMMQVVRSEPQKLRTAHDGMMDLLSSSRPSHTSAPIVCAKHAVVGIGALTDHGVKRGHGQSVEDYQFAQNVGRGPLLADFRSYCLRNLARNEGPRVLHTKPSGSLTTIGLIASKGGLSHDQMSLESKLKFLQKQLGSRDKGVFSSRTIESSILDWKNQLDLIQQSNFYVSVNGEDALPAFFMPPGSSLVLYYDDLKNFAETRHSKPSSRPAMMDWDLWNNLILNVHWLPLSTSNTPKGLNALLQIVENQIDYLLKEASDMVSGIKSEASFGNEKITYVPGRLPSSNVHCLGENFVRSESSCYRTCHLRNICMDLNKRKMILFRTAKQKTLDNYPFLSTRMNTTVMEGRNIRFIENEPWFPEILDVDETSGIGPGYYMLPTDILWVPYTLEPSYASNPGHLLWDFFLPFYTLRTIQRKRLRGNDDRLFRVLLTSIDNECASTGRCRNIVTKFLPLIGSTEILTTDSLEILGGETTRKSDLVCAQHGAAGIGMLTDHGFTRHGQNLEDYQRVHNVGRGPVFYNFRSFMLKNLAIPDPKKRRRKIVFSINSSDNPVRRKDFDVQIAAVRSSLQDVTIETVVLSELSIKDQVKLMVDASVFVSVVGGSTSVATFLPRGATVVLYFATEEDFVGNTRKKDFPTMMDFDFWNNASYLKLHWLPSGSMDEPQDLAYLLLAIQSELTSVRN